MLYLCYSDGFLSYDFGPAHPLNPRRLSLTYDLISESGVLDAPDVRLVKPVPCSEADLISVHSKEYIKAVQAERPNLAFGLGDEDTPVFQGMYDAARLIAGGSIQAAERLVEDDCSCFNLGGGLHHAVPSRAGGFCIFNDPALAILVLRRKFHRILYIDIDAHHCDGVQEIFYRDPEVLKISIHESGRYLFPGTGFIEEIGCDEGLGYCVNIPMPRNSGDDAYEKAFEEIVPVLFSFFKPDAVVAQLGVDTHYSDCLTSLKMTVDGYLRLVGRIKKLADIYSGGRILALGGGGYSLPAVPVAWASALQVLRGMEPESVPCRWVELFSNETGLCPIFLPDRAPLVREDVSERIDLQLNETLSGLKSIISDVHGIF